MLGKSNSSVSNALRKLRDKGLAVSVGYGQWTVPPDPKETTKF